MKILFLSSVNPTFHHSQAAFVVLRSLLEAFAEMGHDVSFATVAPPDKLSEDARVRLKNKGINFLGDFTQDIQFFPKYWKFFPAIKNIIFPKDITDFVGFKKPAQLVETLKKTEADVYLLFWDTFSEYLVPYMHDMKLVAYFGKPSYESSMVRVDALGTRTIFGRLISKLKFLILKQREYMHLKRIRSINKLSNICALDAQKYTANGVPCTYVSNTWPDIFGSGWEGKRLHAQQKRSKTGLLANIGNVSCTGNFFGLSYLADKILPRLNEVLKSTNWEINICGGGIMDKKLKEKLKHPRVNIKGFVKDIDEEMLSNSIFLLLNNAGPLTGGYTRVVYAFSSGACLIAHSNLAKSMPEIKHGYNALLGETADEIVDLIIKACRDEDLRTKISANARRTYEQKYQPKIVAERLLALTRTI